MKNIIKISIISLQVLLMYSFYYDNVREEIINRYENGNKKLLVKYNGQGSNEIVIERITYSESGDTLYWEKPLEKFKMVKKYHCFLHGV